MGKPSTFFALPGQQATTSATSTTVASITLPGKASAILIGVETNDARITFDGTAPTSTTGLKFLKDTAPILVLVGNGQVVKVLSNAAGSSLVTVVPLQ